VYKSIDSLNILERMNVVVVIKVMSQETNDIVEEIKVKGNEC